MLLNSMDERMIMQKVISVKERIGGKKRDNWSLWWVLSESESERLTWIQTPSGPVAAHCYVTKVQWSGCLGQLNAGIIKVNNTKDPVV